MFISKLPQLRTTLSASLVAISLFNPLSVATAAQTVKLDSGSAKLGYTIGVQIMNDLVRNGFGTEIDINALIAAQKDVFNKATLRLTPEQMQEAKNAYTTKMQKQQNNLAANNKKASEAFLVKTKAEKGIKSTASGLLYKVLTEGKGKKPTKEDTVKVHYLGTLIDATQFDSSYERNQPAEFPISGVVPGFSEGLKLMTVGSKYRLFIPADLAYGDRAPATIGPNQTLIFEVELLEIK